MITYLLLLLLSAVVFYRFLRPGKVKRLNVMPGPSGKLESMREMSKLGEIPFIGFHEISKKFGNILRLDMGSVDMTLLGGFEEIKTVHSSDHAEHRAPLDIINIIFTGSKITRGILFNSGQGWKNLRRFTLKTLRDLGFNKSASEDTVVVESKALVEEIGKLAAKQNGIVDLDKLLNKAALNIIWNFVSGTRYEYNDDRLHQLLLVLDSFMMVGTKITGKPISVFPILRYFPPFRSTFIECCKGIEKLRNFIQDTIEEHIVALDRNNPKDYIDMFLVELGTEEYLTKDNLLICCLDLFTAGSETSSKGLMFGIALMIRYPEVQTKVQEEMDRVLGGRDLVTLAEKINLPYTEATVNEVFRFCNVVPVVAPHMATEDINVGEHIIRKGSTILTNTYSVHMDPEYWGDPEVFRPDRFIGSRGKFGQDDRNIPFGIGKRRCLGEGLARMENFLFFSNILYNFRFSPASADGQPPSLEPVAGFSNGPQPFDCKITPRF